MTPRVQGTHEARAYALREAGEKDVDYKNTGMTVLEFKKREMEQQVEVLRLEGDLGTAGHRWRQCVVQGITWMRQTNELGLYYGGSKYEATQVGLWLFVPLISFMGGREALNQNQGINKLHNTTTEYS